MITTILHRISIDNQKPHVTQINRQNNHQYAYLINIYKGRFNYHINLIMNLRKLQRKTLHNTQNHQFDQHFDYHLTIHIYFANHIFNTRLYKTHERLNEQQQIKTVYKNQCIFD